MEEYSIRKIQEKDIESTAKVYAEAFNFANPEEHWTQESAENSVKYWLELRPDLFFVTTIDDEVVGGIVGEIRTYCGEIALVEVELFVSPQHHKKGIAKKLFKAVLTEAKLKYKITGVGAIANSEVDFPMGWYERLGFKQTKWVYIEGKAEELLRNLGE